MIQLLLAVIYLAFISLGLPDSLLGAAWPSIYPELNVPVSYAGAISMTIAAGTIVSSLMSERLTRRFGTGLVTAVSVAMTAAALFGFSISGGFAMLIVFAIPYGLGAGSVDASLNNYVALHYASRHMSWLHCMWGVGASVGPLIMSAALTAGRGWQSGYRDISYIQLGLTLILLISLPLWKKPQSAHEGETARALSLREIVSIRGAKEVMLCFFCYCALEQTAGLWAGSYLVLTRGVDAETAASFAGLYFIGITAGRAVNGFMTLRFSDRSLVRAGEVLIAVGTLVPASAEGRACGLRAARDRLRADIPQHNTLDSGALRRREITGYNRRADGERLCRDMPDAAALWPARRIYRGLAAAGVHRRAACADGSNVRAP